MLTPGQAIEVRPQAQGQVIKAKWIRIELRKVETLPGGGQSNTFFDFVGPSPVTLWQSDDEYGTLRSVCDTSATLDTTDTA